MKAIKNWQRYVLEWGILAALIVFILVSHVIGGRINPDTYCPFGGIQAFANLISHGSLPCDNQGSQNRSYKWSAFRQDQCFHSRDTDCCAFRVSHSFQQKLRNTYNQ